MFFALSCSSISQVSTWPICVCVEPSAKIEKGIIHSFIPPVASKKKKRRTQHASLDSLVFAAKRQHIACKDAIIVAYAGKYSINKCCNKYGTVLGVHVIQNKQVTLIVSNEIHFC